MAKTERSLSLFESGTNRKQSVSNWVRTRLEPQWRVPDRSRTENCGSFKRAKFVLSLTHFILQIFSSVNRYQRFSVPYFCSSEWTKPKLWKSTWRARYARLEIWVSNDDVRDTATTHRSSPATTGYLIHLVRLRARYVGSRRRHKTTVSRVWSHLD